MSSYGIDDLELEDSSPCCILIFIVLIITYLLLNNPLVPD